MINFPINHSHPPSRGKAIYRLGFGLLLIAITFGVYGCATVKPPVSPTTADTAFSSGDLGSPLAFFRKYISSADGDRCPMHPSCSTYSSRAFQKHGPVLGWIMTTDRLMRCGRNELDHSPRIQKQGQVYCHDPVKNNDFWWQE